MCVVCGVGGGGVWVKRVAKLNVAFPKTDTIFFGGAP